MNFKLLSSIDVDRTQSWGQSIFLTLDIDWAHDEVLNDTIDLLESSGIKATWFATHDTKVLERLRVNQNFEIGIHPNFNPLLDGYFSKNKNELLGWEFIDQFNNKVTFNISILKTNVQADKNLFRHPEVN